MSYATPKQPAWPSGIPFDLGRVPPFPGQDDTLAAEIAALRAEIAELRADLRPSKSIILTGAEVDRLYADLARKGEAK